MASTIEVVRPSTAGSATLRDDQRPPRGRRRPHLITLAIVGGYVALGIYAYWPISAFSQSTLPSCACGDQVQEVWFLAWTAHALTHALNPFYTHGLNFPVGANLLDNTSMPLLGLFGLPITAMLGPVATYNFLLHAAITLSALSMYFVARRLGSRRGISFLSGAVFAASAFMVGQGTGHLFLTFVPLPPLIVLVLIETLEGRQSPRRGGLFIGGLSVLQWFISVEVLGGLAVCVVTTLAFVAIARRFRVTAYLASVLRTLGWALVVVLPLLVYPLFFYLAGPGHINGPPHATSALAPYHDDLLSPVVPSDNERVGPSSLRTVGSNLVGGNVPENGGYLGAPLVVLLALLAWRHRRDRLLLGLVVAGGVAFVLSLGSRLTFNGKDLGIPLPFALLERIPIADGFEAARFSLFVQLAVALALARGLTRWQQGRAARDEPRSSIGVLGIAVVVLVPLSPNLPYPHATVTLPPYFTSAAVRSIPRGSAVLTYPYALYTNNFAMLWQATDDMRYSIVGGEIAVAGPKGTSSPPAALEPTEVRNLFIADFLGSSSPLPAPPLDPLGIERVRSFFTRWGVETVIVDPIGAKPAAVVHYLSVALGRAPQRVGGVDLWYHVGIPTSGSTRTVKHAGAIERQTAHAAPAQRGPEIAARR